MISKSNRFHGHNSLTTVYRKGQTVSVPQASLKYFPKKQDKPYRLAIVVSRKVDKSAVVRNRIRRRIYEIMRAKNQDFKINADIVLTVHSKQLENMPTKELDKLIQNLLKKSTITGQ